MKIKRINSEGHSCPWLNDYMVILERFPLYGERIWKEFYDGGSFNHLGSDSLGQTDIMCLAEFISSYAVMAVDPLYDSSVSGITVETLLEHTLSAIRFMTSTHMTGLSTCSDDKKWGGSWQSTLTVSRLALIANVVWDKLKEEDKKAVKKVITWEASHSSRLTPPTREYYDTKAEENGWHLECLSWACCMYPEDENYAKWWTKLNEFAMNAISVEADMLDETIIEGKKVKEWVKGSNVHPDFTIENHDFFHPDYMGSPLASLSMAHYTFCRFKKLCPQSVLYHIRDMWNVFLKFFLWEGRRACVCGNDWPRYEDHGDVLLFLVGIQNMYGDKYARLMEKEIFARYDLGQRLNNDGSFFSQRMLDGVGSRFEKETVCRFVRCYLMHKLSQKIIKPATNEELDRKTRGVTKSYYADFIMVRSEKRFASWGWKSHQKRLGGDADAQEVTKGCSGYQGIISSDKGEHMLEWDSNFSGSIKVEGYDKRKSIIQHKEKILEGGFTTTGEIEECCQRNLSNDFEFQVDIEGERILEDIKIRDVDHRQVTNIMSSEHPIFATKNKVSSLEGLEEHDGFCTSLSPQWKVLIQNCKNQPSIFEACIGEGKVIISLADIVEFYLKNLPGSQIFKNILDYLSKGRKGKIGIVSGYYLYGLVKAMSNMGADFEELENLTTKDLLSYKTIVIDKEAWADWRVNYDLILDYLKNGGAVLQLPIRPNLWAGWDPKSYCSREYALRRYVSFSVLPDRVTSVLVNYVIVNKDVEVTEQKGLNWNIANDIFNQNKRTFYYEKGDIEIQGVGGEDRIFELESKWLNIDNQISLIGLKGPDKFTLNDYSRRTIGSGSILREVVNYPQILSPQKYKTNEVAEDTMLVFRLGLTHQQTSRLSMEAYGSVVESNDPLIKIVSLAGVDNSRYLIISNFNETAKEAIVQKLKINIDSMTTEVIYYEQSLY